MIKQRIALGLAALGLAAAVGGAWYWERTPRDSRMLPAREAPLAAVGGELRARAAITPRNASQVVQLARLGDGGGVALQASADQRLLAVGMDHVGVAIYDAQTLERQRLVEMPYEADGLRAQDRRVAVSSDGGTIAAGLGQIAIIHTADGRLIRLNPIDVSALALAPGGATLATVGQQIRIWRTTDGALERSFDNPVFSSGFLDATTATFSPDGALLLVAQEDLAVVVRVADGERVRSLDGAVGAFAPDGGWVATSFGTGAVAIWRLSDGEPAITLGGVMGRTADADPRQYALLAISADSSLVAASAWDGRVRVWRVSDGALVADHALAGAAQPPRGLAIAPDNRGLTLLSGAGTLSQIQLAGGAVRHTVALPSESAWHLHFSEDGGQLLATGRLAERTGIATWQMRDLTRAAERPIALTIADKDLYMANVALLSGGSEGPLLWQPRDASAPPVIAEGERWYAGALAPDGAQLASTTVEPGVVTVLRTADQSVVRSLPLSIEERDRANRITAIYSADGDQLVAANGRTVWIWRASDGTLLRSFSMLDRAESSPLLTAAALSPDAQVLATSGYQGVQLWSTETGARLATLASASDALATALCFSPDGHVLAVADRGAVRLWGVP